MTQRHRYEPGDIAMGDGPGRYVLVIAEIIADVYLAAAIIAAENPVIPGSATGSYYVEAVDGYVVPTLVRAYRAEELEDHVSTIAGTRPFDLTRSLYRAALGLTR